MTGLLLAFILSWFGFDVIFATGMNELFGLHLTSAGYYVSFFLVSILIELATIIRTKIIIKG